MNVIAQLDSDAANTPEIEACPICTSVKTEELFHHNEETPIRKCSECQSEFSGRYFTGEELAIFYGSTYFQGEYGYRDYQALADMKRRTFSERLVRLEKLIGSYRGKHLLDVGCADGLLVRTACEHGWIGWGLDISASAVESAKSLAASDEERARLFSGILEEVELGRSQFDAIVMSDMIEHVHDPLVVLSRARTLLAPGGVILLETPQAEGLMHKLMRRRWPMYRPPEHLLYFSQRGLSQLLEKAGFQVLSSSPSTKAFTLPYLRDKLRVSNPRLAATLAPVCALVGRLTFWIPSGSFVVLARRQ